MELTPASCRQCILRCSSPFLTLDDGEDEDEDAGEPVEDSADDGESEGPGQVMLLLILGAEDDAAQDRASS